MNVFFYSVLSLIIVIVGNIASYYILKYVQDIKVKKILWKERQLHNEMVKKYYK